MPDLTILHAVPTDNWEDSLANVVSDMGGRTLNVHQLLANNAQLLEAWWPLRMYAVSGGALGKRNAELVILRTAVHMRQWYEWASHVERGLKQGLSAEDIERVTVGPDASGWSEQDAMLLTAVDELHQENALSPSLLRRLGKHFAHDQILDAIAIRSMYVMLGGVLNSWKIALDRHVTDSIPESETEQGFINKLDGKSA